MTATPTPRKRRSAAESQRLILDAAQKLLTEAGPEAVRLIDVAAAVGISHPTVLHHFGTRDGLMQALEKRALEQLAGDLISRLGIDDLDIDAMLDRVAQTFGDDGLARLLAWQLLSGRDVIDVETERVGIVKSINEEIHAEILAEHAAQEIPAPEPDRGAFCVRLAATALFGEAILGDALTQSAGLGDPVAVRKRFRHWLSVVLSSLPAGPIGE